jgi:hypothetical protein
MSFRSVMFSVLEAAIFPTSFFLEGRSVHNQECMRCICRQKLWGRWLSLNLAPGSVYFNISLSARRWLGAPAWQRSFPLGVLTYDEEITTKRYTMFLYAFWQGNQSFQIQIPFFAANLESCYSSFNYLFTSTVPGIFLGRRRDEAGWGLRNTRQRLSQLCSHAVLRRQLRWN